MKIQDPPPPPTKKQWGGYKTNVHPPKKIGEGGRFQIYYHRESSHRNQHPRLSRSLRKEKRERRENKVVYNGYCLCHQTCAMPCARTSLRPIWLIVSLIQMGRGRSQNLLEVFPMKMLMLVDLFDQVLGAIYYFFSSSINRVICQCVGQFRSVSWVRTSNYQSLRFRSLSKKFGHAPVKVELRLRQFVLRVGVKTSWGGCQITGLRPAKGNAPQFLATIHDTPTKFAGIQVFI